MSQFFTLAEILPYGGEALPASMSKLAEYALDWRGDPRRARMRWGKGGGWEYHVSLLPLSVQAAIAACEPSHKLGGQILNKACAPISSGGAGKNPSSVPLEHLLPQGEKEVQSGGAGKDCPPPTTNCPLPISDLPTPDLPYSPAFNPSSEAVWSAFERLSKPQQDVAAKRQNAVNAVHKLVNISKACAVALIAKQVGISQATLWNWLKQAATAPRSDVLAVLASKRAGRTTLAPCDPHAWDYLVADYLRPEKPKFEVCYDRLTRAAAEHGWQPVPSSKTLKRRLEREFPRAVITLAREGAESVQRIYPHQTRSKGHFHALEAINGDGHKFDVDRKSVV